MALDSVNHVLFDALNATGAHSGTLAALQALAEVPVYGLPALVAGVWIFGDRASRQTAAMAFLAACLAMAAAHAASVMIDRPRPFMLELAPNLLGHPDDSSFPSDHTTVFFALAVAFGRRASPHLPGLAWCLAVLGLAVGLARVALGVHFPVDIACGMAIGAGAALATDLGLRRVGAGLFAFGENLRRLVRPLAAHDDREVAG